MSRTLSPQVKQEIEQICQRYPTRGAALLPAHDRDRVAAGVQRALHVDREERVPHYGTSRTGAGAVGLLLAWMLRGKR